MYVPSHYAHKMPARSILCDTLHLHWNFETWPNDICVINLCKCQKFIKIKLGIQVSFTFTRVDRGM